MTTRPSGDNSGPDGPSNGFIKQSLSLPDKGSEPASVAKPDGGGDLRQSFPPRLDILPAHQKALWAGLHTVAEDGFVLYGGTAIALRLGHRVSVDFDFFRQDPVNQDWLLSRYPFCLSATVIQAAPNTLSILVPGEVGVVKLSFFGAITHGRVGNPSWTSDGVLEVASLADLLATKLKTIQQRVEKKDYLDIHAILAAGLRLDEGLASAQTLYGKTFHPMTALKALIYHEDGNLGELQFEVKKALIRAVAEIQEIPLPPRVHRTLRGEA